MAHERLFDYPFEFQKYIEERLREFDDVEERKFAKSILMDGLLHIIEETEDKYTLLEKRIRDEVENKINKYIIRMTIIKREDYDPTNPTWFPIVAEDLNGNGIIPENILDDLENKTVIALGMVYIIGDDKICTEIEREDVVLKGKIITDKGDFPAKFQMRKSPMHLKKISDLYELFNQNSIAWTTLQCAYIQKCYAIELTEMNVPPESEVKFTGYVVDYGQYAPFIRENVIPLWNVEKIYYNCEQFPLPCIDTINYEHEFPSEKFGSENGFLLESNENIANFRYQEEKIYVATSKITFNNWGAYRVIGQEPVKSLGYTQPVLSNRKKKTFIGDFMKQSQIGLHTKADLQRKLYEMDLEKYIRYVDCEVISIKDNGFKNGDMNWFIEDELFDKNSRRILLLKFQAVNKDNYLNGAFVRYATSEIQREQAEYYCMGVLI